MGRNQLESFGTAASPIWMDFVGRLPVVGLDLVGLPTDPVLAGRFGSGIGGNGGDGASGAEAGVCRPHVAGAPDWDGDQRGGDGFDLYRGFFSDQPLL